MLSVLIFLLYINCAFGIKDFGKSFTDRKNLLLYIYAENKQYNNLFVARLVNAVYADECTVQSRDDTFDIILKATRCQNAVVDSTCCAMRTFT